LPELDERLVMAYETQINQSLVDMTSLVAEAVTSARTPPPAFPFLPYLIVKERRQALLAAEAAETETTTFNRNFPV
jgi:hypothetical protein